MAFQGNLGRLPRAFSYDTNNYPNGLSNVIEWDSGTNYAVGSIVLLGAAGFFQSIGIIDSTNNTVRPDSNDAASIWRALGSSTGGSVAINNNGTEVTDAATRLTFTGDGVTASDPNNNNQVTINIPGATGPGSGVNNNWRTGTSLVEGQLTTDTATDILYRPLTGVSAAANTVRPGASVVPDLTAVIGDNLSHNIIITDGTNTFTGRVQTSQPESTHYDVTLSGTSGSRDDFVTGNNYYIYFFANGTNTFITAGVWTLITSSNVPADPSDNPVANQFNWNMPDGDILEIHTTGMNLWEEVSSSAGSSTFAGLTDTNINRPAEGQIAVWNNDDQQWENVFRVTPVSVGTVSAMTYASGANEWQIRLSDSTIMPVADVTYTASLVSPTNNVDVIFTFLGSTVNVVNNVWEIDNIPTASYLRGSQPTSGITADTVTVRTLTRPPADTTPTADSLNVPNNLNFTSNMLQLRRDSTPIGTAIDLSSLAGGGSTATDVNDNAGNPISAVSFFASSSVVDPDGPAWTFSWNPTTDANVPTPDPTATYRATFEANSVNYDFTFSGADVVRHDPAAGVPGASGNILTWFIAAADVNYTSGSTPSANIATGVINMRMLVIPPASSGNTDISTISTIITRNRIGVWSFSTDTNPGDGDFARPSATTLRIDRVDANGNDRANDLGTIVVGQTLYIYNADGSLFDSFEVTSVLFNDTDNILAVTSDNISLPTVGTQYVIAFGTPIIDTVTGLRDTEIGTLSPNQVLTWDGAHWVNQTPDGNADYLAANLAPNLLSTGFLVLTLQSSSGARDQWRDTNGVLGPVNTDYFFDNTAAAWFTAITGGTRIIGY